VKTIRELIQVTADYLAGKDVESARLNAERLLGDVLGISRLELYLQHDRPVVGDELDRYRELVRRRAAGEPLQHILGATGFYSRDFKVVPGVFIPRPETERLVERSLGLLSSLGDDNLSPLAAEVGCGSGIIAVTLAAEAPRLEVWATDVNPAAVELTGVNAHRHGVGERVHALLGSRFDPLPARLRGGLDLLVSNPPYVRRGELAGLPREVRHDPPEALDGGEDGLDFYRALAAGAARWLKPGGWFAVEIGADQGEAVAGIFGASQFADVEIGRDYNDLQRVVAGRRPVLVS
jgi:release factor glutamine methyltransferase